MHPGLEVILEECFVEDGEAPRLRVIHQLLQAQVRHDVARVVVD